MCTQFLTRDLHLILLRVSCVHVCALLRAVCECMSVGLMAVLVCEGTVLAKMPFRLTNPPCALDSLSQALTWQDTAWGGISAGHVTAQPEPVFKRLESEEEKAAAAAGLAPVKPAKQQQAPKVPKAPKAPKAPRKVKVDAEGVAAEAVPAEAAAVEAAAVEAVTV